MALFAGMIGLGALLAFQAVLARLVPLPPEQQPLPDASQMPLLTQAALVIMGSFIAGFTEEAGFRGYMQGAIAERHGPMDRDPDQRNRFRVRPFLTPDASDFAHLPYYIAVSAVFGMLAYLTGSIMPGVVLHTFGDTFEGLMLVASGRTTWPEASPSHGLVWQSGADSSFWAMCAWAALWIAGAVLVYRALASEVRSAATPLELRRRHGQIQS